MHKLPGKDWFPRRVLVANDPLPDEESDIEDARESQECYYQARRPFMCNSCFLQSTNEQEASGKEQYKSWKVDPSKRALGEWV